MTDNSTLDPEQIEIPVSILKFGWGESELPVMLEVDSLDENGIPKLNSWIGYILLTEVQDKAFRDGETQWNDSLLTVEEIKRVPMAFALEFPKLEDFKISTTAKIAYQKLNSKSNLLNIIEV